MLVASLGAALALPTAAAARTTQATIFHAFTIRGTPTIHTSTQRGTCFSSSETINRRDAWRCGVKNRLYDPCFSSTLAPGVVICPNIALSGGVKIRLTSSLPFSFANRAAPSLRDQPWALELENGKHAAFSGGASSLLDGRRANYFFGSTGSSALWGSPNRRVEPWTIFEAPLTATTLSQRVAIKHAWM